jgi:hypothetical protein
MAGKSPCHCPHLDVLKDRVDAAEARLAEADKFCEILQQRVSKVEETRERFLKDGAFNPGVGGGGLPTPPGPGGNAPGGGGCGDGGPSFGGGAGNSSGASGNSSDAVKWSSKIFDARVGQSELYQYNGDVGGDAWRIRARGYLIGCCPEIAPILNWIEDRDALEIDQNDSQLTMTRELNRSMMGESDKVVLSGLVWSFLQHCCTKNAATTVHAAKPELNGFEVWRSLVWEINQGKQSRMLMLRRTCRGFRW